jgi:hypothetical protein
VEEGDAGAAYWGLDPRAGTGPRRLDWPVPDDRFNVAEVLVIPGAGDSMNRRACTLARAPCAA